MEEQSTGRGFGEESARLRSVDCMRFDALLRKHVFRE